MKIHAKLILVKGDDVYAVCKGCGSEIPIPMKVDTDVAKSISKKSEPRLYLQG